MTSIPKDVFESDTKDVSDSQIEDIKQLESSDAENAYHVDINEGFDSVALKKTLRKVDFRVLPVLMAMYCVSQMDRSNLSLARAANNSAMAKDLGLTIGQRYSLVTLAFFPPYIALEIPVRQGSDDLTAVPARSPPLRSSYLAWRCHYRLGLRHARYGLQQDVARACWSPCGPWRF